MSVLTFYIIFVLILDFQDFSKKVRIFWIFSDFWDFGQVFFLKSTKVTNVNKNCLQLAKQKH